MSCRGAARRAIFGAKDAGRGFCEDLEGGAGVYMLAKRLVDEGRDVEGAGCVRDGGEGIVVGEDGLMEILGSIMVRCQVRSLLGAGVV